MDTADGPARAVQRRRFRVQGVLTDESILPHHVVQRGNRCQDVFFLDAERELRLGLLGAGQSLKAISTLSTAFALPVAESTVATAPESRTSCVATSNLIGTPVRSFPRTGAISRPRTDS